MIRSPWPCFLGTQKMGKLYSESDLQTTLSFNHSSKVCSMMSLRYLELFLVNQLIILEAVLVGYIVWQSCLGIIGPSEFSGSSP